jgi:hypothetical protein
MRDEKADAAAERPMRAGPMAGALGFALLGAALLRFWRRWRDR